MNTLRTDGEIRFTTSPRSVGRRNLRCRHLRGRDCFSANYGSCWPRGRSPPPRLCSSGRSALSRNGIRSRSAEAAGLRLLLIYWGRYPWDSPHWRANSFWDIPSRPSNSRTAFRLSLARGMAALPISPGLRGGHGAGLVACCRSLPCLIHVFGTGWGLHGIIWIRRDRCAPAPTCPSGGHILIGLLHRQRVAPYLVRSPDTRA